MAPGGLVGARVYTGWLRAAPPWSLEYTYPAAYMKDNSPERRLTQFIARYTPEIAVLAQKVLDGMRARLPGAVQLVYDNYNALAIGFGPTERHPRSGIDRDRGLSRWRRKRTYVIAARYRCSRFRLFIEAWGYPRSKRHCYRSTLWGGDLRTPFRDRLTSDYALSRQSTGQA
jgi:hypothetical protein